MPFVKDITSLLIECAGNDIKTDTRKSIRESVLKTQYASIKEATQTVVYSAEMVPVIQLPEGVFTEMSFLHPFMKTNNIKSITTALNIVAEANKLPHGGVGLMIESKEAINKKINDAKAKGAKAEEKAKETVDKANKVVEKLKDKGIPVITKKEQCCSECGKPISECKCKK